MTRRSFSVRHLSGAVTGAILLFATAAHSQQAPGNQSPEQPAADKPPELKEVVVTAQKMRQTLEQVPASVSSLGGEYIDKTGARNYQDLQYYTANTNLQVSPSSTQLLIRGFGTLNDVPGLDPSVGVVVDGVVFTYPEYLTAFFTDLDRYEVLRGPQGTLFGKNVTAGLLNITTNSPDPKDLFARVTEDARSYGSRAFQPIVNLPLGSKTALRFAGNFDHGDHGALYNTDLDRPEANVDEDTARARLHFDSGDDWTMDLTAFGAHHEQNFNKQQLYEVTPYMNALALHYDPRFTATIDDTVSENVSAEEKAITRGTMLVFNGDLGHPGGMKSLRITSISSTAENIIGARDLDADFSPVPFIQDSLVQPETERQFTQELRVSGEAPDAFGLGHQATFVAGLYYDNYTLGTSDNFQLQNLGSTAEYIIAANAPQVIALCAQNPHLCGNLPSNPTPDQFVNWAVNLGDAVNNILARLNSAFKQPLVGPQFIQSGLSQRTQDYAAFGQGEWFFTERWSLLLGLRYALEDRKGTAFSHSSSAIIKAIAGQEDYDEPVARTEHDFSPKAGIKFQPTQHIESYFTWSEGYKSGGFNSISLTPDNIEFGPEKASSFEAGFKIKDHLFNGPIRGSISVYHTHFSNLQVSLFQGTTVEIVNAAAARSQGFEAELMWLLPLKGVSLYSSFGYSDARYVSYPDGPPIPGQTPCPPAPQPCTQDLTGKRLPFAPDWTAALSPSYTFAQLPHGITASVAMDVLFQGDRYLNTEDGPQQLQASTLMLNPRLNLGDDVHGDWGLNLGIQNFTKQIYCDQVIDQPLAPGNSAAIRTERGRIYSGSFFWTFR